MKRYLLALCSVLGLAFIGLSPTQAQAQAMTCAGVTVAGGAYPQGYLWQCGNATTGHQPSTTDVDAAISALSSLGGPMTGTANAKTLMSNANHYVYIFQTQQDFITYCNQVGNPTPTPATCPVLATIAGDNGYTYPVQVATEQSIIFAGTTDLSANSNVAQTTDHEVGHQLDDIYGVKLYTTGSASQVSREFATKLQGMAVTVGGTIHAGDVLKITMQPIGGSLVTVSYTVVSGDTLATIGSELTSLINASSIHSTPYFGTATSLSGFISFSLNSSSILSYSTSVSVGATESLALNKYDWPATNLVTPQCNSSDGLFTDQKDQNGKFICGTLVSGSVDDTPTVGDVYAFTVTDTTPTLINEPVSYTVPASPTPTQETIAAGIIAKINADAVLSARHITAISGGSSFIEITSGTQTTSYSAPTVTPSGEGHGAWTLGSVSQGSGNTLSNSYSGTNSQVMQAAWSNGKDFITIPDGATAYWEELFADNTAQVSGQNKGGNQNPSAYYENNGFICTLEYVKSVLQTGLAPGTAGGLPYNSGCK
jgi:hypothetical protein